MDSQKTVLLAIDAGGTNLKTAILNTEGEVLEGSSSSVKSASDGSKYQIIQAFEKAINQSLKYLSERKLELKGISIAFPGPFNIYEAKPLMKHKYQAIYGLDMRSFIQNLPGISDKIPIRFMHDANAALEGEIKRGNGIGFSNVAAITLGTGLGIAVSENGKVLQNEIGGPFISIFQLPYKNRILEDYVSKKGFLRVYQEISGRDDVIGVEVSDLGKWAEDGDQSCIETFRVVAQILSESIQDILKERNIECLLFSGQISRSFHLMEETIMKELKHVQCLKKISVVKSIDNAALYGVCSNIL